METQTEAEAFACVAVMMAAADGIGTLEEGHYIFDTLANLPVFENLDAAGFRTVLSDANRRVSSFAHVDGGSITEEGIASLLGQIREALSPDLRTQVVQMAFDLARSDDVSREEEELMKRIRLELQPRA